MLKTVSISVKNVISTQKQTNKTEMQTNISILHAQMWRLCHLQQLTVLVCSVCFATLQLVWDVPLHYYCLKTTHWHVLFLHSHYTLQILIGDSKVTSKLAKIIHLFLILWWCLISYFRTLQLVRVVDLFFKLDYFLKTTHSHGLIFHSNITLEILISES